MEKSKVFHEISHWMYRNARPIDLARWQYHYENGERNNVLRSLLAYQNEDGGFGHALEADCWNRESSPIQTWKACEILQEIDCPREHPIVGKVIAYLQNTSHFNGGFWLAQIHSNNDYPRAPWWTFTDGDNAVWGYNPTAALAGFVLVYGNREQLFYQTATRIAEEAFDHYLKSTSISDDMHELSSYIRLLDCLKRSGLPFKHEGEIQEKLQRNVSHLIEKDRSQWGLRYCTMPSQFIDGPANIFFLQNEQVVEEELNYLLDNRESGGVWSVPWEWGMYEREFSVSENWWRADLALSYTKLLHSFGRI
ncbi:hypothetical protein [Bacillus sp. 1P06AnD]|uniref:hypothetical protein n=1 Tax=Bacillus sp. 1P06AnD TaxID=3132208 RepID=UPI0039A0B0CE